MESIAPHTPLTTSGYTPLCSPASVFGEKYPVPGTRSTESATEITEVTEDDTTGRLPAGRGAGGTSATASAVVPKALTVAVLCALCALCGRRRSVTRSRRPPCLSVSVVSVRRLPDRTGTRASPITLTELRPPGSRSPQRRNSEPFRRVPGRAARAVGAMPLAHQGHSGVGVFSRSTPAPGVQ